MKQYLSPEQTAKLIELGFEKPKSAIGYSYPEQSDKQKAYEASLGLEPYLATVDQIKFEYAYSIGELIEMLPENVAKENEIPSTLNISLMNGEWCVQYADFLGIDFVFCNTELINALYDMLIRLKEKEVI